MEPGHVIAFYGKKGSTRAGLSVDQSMDACNILSKIPVWMGYMAKVKARAISLQEANEMVVGLKRLEKEDLKKVRMELHHRLSSWRLGHSGSNLSTSTGLFITLATVTDPKAATTVSTEAAPAVQVPRPLYSSDDEGATTENVIPKKKSRKQGSRGKKGKRDSQSEMCDSGSETTGSSSSNSLHSSFGNRNCNRKKFGVTNKVQITEFDGKTSNAWDIGDAFRRWSQSISYYWDYYEDEYLLSQIIGALKGDAADVFDFACHHGNKHTKDLGLILEHMRHHYCGILTFREQCNTVKSMR